MIPLSAILTSSLWLLNAAMGMELPPASVEIDHLGQLHQTDRFLRRAPKDKGWLLPASQMDVVSPMKEVTCITNLVIDGITRYFGPRRILVVTKTSECPKLASVTKNAKVNVTCVNQDRVLPNITLATLHEKLAAMGKISGGSRGFGGHSVAGWYFQQFIKLGIAATSNLPGGPLSKTYLVWDSDMIPVKPFNAFSSDGRIQMMKSDGNPCHIDGYKGVCHYAATHKKLLNENCVASAEGLGFISHHMVAYRPFVRELLEALTSTANRSDPWQFLILESACETNRICNCGFSEYHSMSAWMMQHHPGAVTDVAQNFVRKRVKGARCCPSPDDLARQSAGQAMLVLERGRCDD